MYLSHGPKWKVPFSKLYSFKEFVKLVGKKDPSVNGTNSTLSQSHWYRPGMVCLRFENIEREFVSLCETRLGFNKGQIKLPHRMEKSGDCSKYQQIYTPKMREIMEKVYEHDLKEWEYSFE